MKKTAIAPELSTRVLSHIAELAEDNRRLRSELADAVRQAAHWRDRHGRVMEIDNGAYSTVNGWEGGLIPTSVTLDHYSPETPYEPTRRTYRFVVDEEPS